MSTSARAKPAWAQWHGTPQSAAYTIGVEEEVMLVDPRTAALAQDADRVLPALSSDLARHATAETHGSALELATGVHDSVPSARREIAALRARLLEELEPMGLAAASAGTHPTTVWHETVVSGGARYQEVYGSMRELARREPTFSLHVHVGVPEPEAAIRLFNRLRGHLPLLLALSANSPYWQGRDTGLASARTPLFQAFPRVGVPRAFDDYDDYVDTVDLLVRCEAFPDPTFLWWDVRPQPRFGTVEVRIMDAQTTVEETASLAALVQSIARLELEEGWISDAMLELPEVLEENRFLAARDGVGGRLVDPGVERRVPLRDRVEDLLDACGPHARALGCEDELLAVSDLLDDGGGAGRQRRLADEGGGLPGLLLALADCFGEEG